MDEISTTDRDVRVAGWMDLFRDAAARPEFQVPAAGARPFDFEFRAAGEPAAHRLAAWFRAHTTYTVRVEHRAPADEDAPRRALEGWRVGGETPPIDPAPRVFEQWLAFVVWAGLSHGCELEACSGIDLAQSVPSASRPAA